MARAKLTLPNGCYAELRTTSDVKKELKAIRSTLSRLELHGWIQSKAYDMMRGKEKLLTWYLDVSTSVRKQAIFSYWQFEAVPDCNGTLLSEAEYSGAYEALYWLMTYNPSGLIADALPVQQTF